MNPSSPAPPLLKVHVISETAWITKGQGVHTAFLDCLALLKSEPDIDVVINQEGWGDVLHSHTYGPYYFWKGRRYRGRRVFTSHVIPASLRGSMPGAKFLLPFVRWYLRRVYSFADVCIAISPEVEDTIRAMVPSMRVVRILNPISPTTYTPTAERRAAGRKRLDIDSKQFLVIGVGQIQGRKGLDDFFKVAEACPDLKFAWIGGRPFGLWTEGVARLNAKIAAGPPNLTFPGLFDISEMPELYAAADMMLFPSYQENCPLAPLEGAAAELPVVFRDIPELARLYESPYLKGRSVEEFAALTRRLANDATFYASARDMSRQLVSQFEPTRIRQQLVSLYRELAGPLKRAVLQVQPDSLASSSAHSER